MEEVAKNLGSADKNEPVHIIRKTPGDTEELSEMTLDIAKRSVWAAECAAGLMGISIAAAVSDNGGNLICLHVMDKIAAFASKTAQNKACGIMPGGEAILADGKIAGAIGVAGGNDKQNALIAKAAVKVLEEIS